MVLIDVLRGRGRKREERPGVSWSALEYRPLRLDAAYAVGVSVGVGVGVRVGVGVGWAGVVGVGAGPLLTTRLTVSPGFAVAPAAGSVEMTRPEAIVGSA